MVSKGHFGGGILLGQVEEEKTEDEAYEVGDEVDGVGDDGDGVGDDPGCNLAPYEDKGD